MKNIFYFNKDFELNLLLNEQCENNCIFFVIETDERANQYLDIVCGTQTTSQLLESGTVNKIELTGERWATGGCTTFKLRNDDTETVWYQIDFPETMSTDMCVCETSDCCFAAQCQKSEFDVNEIKSSTLIYKNTREYTIDTTSKKIIFIQYTVLQEVNATFTATILLKAYDIEDTAKVKFKIQVNKIYNEIFIPTQTITNGEHIITIHYPIADPVMYNANTINVYAEIDSGYAVIEQEKIIASLTATGLMTDTTWDGTIEAEDTASVELSNLDIAPITDTADVSYPDVESQDIADTVSVNMQRLNVSEVTEDVSVSTEEE